MTDANFQSSPSEGRREPRIVPTPPLCGRVAPREWSNPGHCASALHRKRAFWLCAARALLIPGLVLGLLVAVISPLHAGERQSTSGWLTLERDQRTYREQVAPLDLREERELSVIERRQRNDLRAVEQRGERRQRLERQPRVSDPPEVPRRELNGAGRRDNERRRLDLRMEQYRLPYGRRPQ
jgi:hypothetical protein